MQDAKGRKRLGIVGRVGRQFDLCVIGISFVCLLRYFVSSTWSALTLDIPFTHFIFPLIVGTVLIKFFFHYLRSLKVPLCYALK